MIKKKNRSLLVLIVFFFLALLLAIVPCITLEKTQAYDLTLNIFSSRKMEIETCARLSENSAYSDSRRGVRIKGNSGSYVTMRESVSGEYDMQFVPEEGLKSLIYTFENTQTEESFDLVVAFKAEKVSAYVCYNGECVGLYHHANKGLSNVTAIYNSSGVYTQYANAYKAHTVSFNPESMSVSLDGYLVWSLLSNYADGRKVNFALNPFEQYTVKMTFNEAKNASSAILYEINGQELNSQLIRPSVAPRIFANFTHDGVVNEKYTLPKGNAYDVLDGAMTEKNCSVEVIFEETTVPLEYGAFTPTKKGAYTVNYTATNAAGFTSSKSYTLNVRDSYGGEMVFAGALPDTEIGANTKLIFPAVEYLNDGIKTVGKISVSAAIYKNEELVKTIENAREGFSYTPTEEGNYKAVFSPVESYYGKDIHTVEFSVNADKIGYTLDSELQSTYTLSERVYIPKMTMHTSEGDLSAKSVICFPDGSMYDNKRIDVDVAGTYQIIYTATGEQNSYEIIKSFDVLVSPASLFSTKGSVSMKNGTFSHIQNVNGLVVEMQNGSEINYNNVIHLNEYSYYNDKNNALLCELFVDPYVAFNADFLNLELVLTDVYNPNNYVTIVLSSLWESVNSFWSVLRASHSGLPTVGLEGVVDGKGTHNPVNNDTTKSIVHVNQAGFLFNGSISATPHHQTLKSLISTKIYFDYETKSIHAQYDDGNSARSLVADLDHDAYFSELWEGFETGECTLTIRPKSFQNSTGRIILLSVDGHDFGNGEFRDETAPKLSVDVADKNGDANIPNGVAGMPYPLFNALAIDDIDGVVDVQKRVYYNFLNYIFDINVSDGQFLPEYSGEYLVVYTAKDLSGNVSEYSLTVTVEEESFYKENPLTVTVEADYATEVGVGELVSIADIVSVGGGVGRTECNTYVLDPEGNQVALSDGQFRLSQVGDYSVCYELVDYLGKKDVWNYTIKSLANNNVIFISENITLPKAILTGIEYTLPQMSVLDYTNGLGEEKQAILTAKDQNGNDVAIQDGTIAITNADVSSITLTYACPDTEHTTEYSIPVRQSRDAQGSYNYDAYFYGENVDTSLQERWVALRTSTKGAKVEILSELLAQNLNLELKVNETVSESRFNAFSVIFTDAENAAIAVELTVVKNGDGASVILHDGTTAAITGSFTGQSNYRITFKYNDKKRNFEDAQAASLGEIKTCRNGNPFEGFTSGTVKAEIVFKDIEGESELDVYVVNNQNFVASNRKDRRAPEISYEESISRTQQPNTTITIPHFQAEDVLGNVALFVSVQNFDTKEYIKDTDGNLLNRMPYEKGMRFVLSDISEYVIILHAKDYMIGDEETRYLQEETRQIRITVRDDVAPTISLNGSVPGSGRVNSTITLPTATVNDNCGADDVRLMVYWITPDNVTTCITPIDGKYSFKPTVAGTYTIKYVALDKHFNYAEITATVVVN